MTIQDTRIQVLKERAMANGRYVLYWMQQSQRAEENHALAYAIDQANRQGVPVLVGFGLMDDYPGANLRHYTFMLEGLKETKTTLAGQGIQLVVRKGHPVSVALDLGQQASMIVCDRGYLEHQKSWRHQVADKAGCRVVQVESDVVVPAEVVSDKAEYAARTIRPKIRRLLDNYLEPVKPRKVQHPTLALPMAGMDLDNLTDLLACMKIDRTISPVTQFFTGGTSQAKTRFNDFIENRFHLYVNNRNQPQTLDISCMSPYLHFGQISPLYLALKVQACHGRLNEAREAYLEELVVRRELAVNFVLFNPLHDSFDCLPEWAKKTLTAHAKDSREYTYTRTQLEKGQTHDPYWNAAMAQMRVTGFMHNYMRMYWGKKILEWSDTPQKAYETALAINNRYFLDGRDPNSYAGVAWVFGLHDRAWFERAIFGKVRYMAASGLERKCDIKSYVKQMELISGEGPGKNQ